jgi:hypothetical protein
VAIPLQGTIASVCVSDTGLLLVAITNGSGGVEISSVSAQGAVHQLMQVARYGDMRFIGSSNGVLIADAGQNILWSAKDAASGSNLVQIAGTGDGLQNPVATASSWDGHWALIANQAGTLLRIDLTQMTPTLSVACSCIPSTLAPLSGNATFQITPLATGPMWLYEGDLATPRTVFVPAVDNNQG